MKPRSGFPFLGLGLYVLDVQVFDDELVKKSQQEQYLADRDGVGSNLPRILPLICFPDGISWKTSLIACPIALSFSPGFSCAPKIENTPSRHPFEPFVVASHSKYRSFVFYTGFLLRVKEEAMV